VQEEAVSE